MGFSPNHIEPLARDPGREPTPFEVFDIESNNWTKLVVMGHYDGKVYRDFGSMKEFLHHLTDLNPDLSIPDDRVLYAHNGGAFDFNFVLQYVVKEEGRKNFRIENIMPRGSSFLCIEIRRLYWYPGQAAPEEGPLLTFRDSLAMLPFALASLTESFKTECAKGSWDHDYDFKYRWDPMLRQYLRDDCVGLYQVIEKYTNWPLIREAGAAHTVASQALRCFRTFLKDRLPGCPKGVDPFVRKAYFGGRTEVFKPYFITKDPLYHRMKEEGDKWSKEQWDHYDKEMEKCEDVFDEIDANSLYPSVMRDFEYPTKFKKWTYKYDPKSLGFWEAEVDVPKGMYVPPLGTLIHIDQKTKKVTKVYDSSQGKFIFPTGRFKIIASTAELEYARSIGVKIVSTGRGAIFESGGHIFKDFINELYEMRKRAAKDSVDSFICKLLMNSSYGRFGLNLLREQLVIDEGQDNVGDSCYEFETGEIHNGKPVVMRFVRENKYIESFTNVAIAAYVTSYARIRMHKHYMKFPRELHYTDTDSMFYRRKGKASDSKELGEFKYEYSGAEGCWLLPKTYAMAGIIGLKDKKGKIIRSKAVIKGVAKESIRLRGVNVKDLYTLLEGDFKRASIGPIDPLEFKVKAKFAKVRTAMRRGTFLYVQPGQTRTIKSRYDKRVIVKDRNGNYDTVPIHIEGEYAHNYCGGQLLIKVSNEKGKEKVEFTGEAVQTVPHGGRKNQKRRTKSHT